MQVCFKRTWFSPRGRFRFKGKNIYQEVPDKFLKLLPSDAHVLEDKEKVSSVVEEASPDTFSEMNKLHEEDVFRAEAEATARIQEQAEKAAPTRGRPKKKD